MSKMRRVGLAALAVATAAAAIAASAAARPATRQAAVSSKISCANGVTFAVMAPITGPAASIGADQLHWAQYMAAQWNKTHKLKVHIFQGDTQLDPSKASTVAQQIASNSKILGVVGPAGSQEVLAVTPIFKKASLGFVSGSATLVKLTNGSARGYFFRVVPNDNLQGSADAQYMLTKLGVKKGDTVMIIDDQEAYSTGLADIVQSKLTKAGVKVDRESVSQKATDFSSLVAKVGPSTKVVFLPFQLASQAQLVAQQLKAQGKSAIVFGSDGTFDSKNFNTPGAYVSFFAPDVTTIPEDRAIVAGFKKQFKGGTTPFGAPNYVLAQMYSIAITKACADGKISRAELRKDFAKVSLKKTILGTPVRFTSQGDLAGAKFHIFKIQSNGSYKTVA